MTNFKGLGATRAQLVAATGIMPVEPSGRSATFNARLSPDLRYANCLGAGHESGGSPQAHIYSSGAMCAVPARRSATFLAPMLAEPEIRQPAKALSDGEAGEGTTLEQADARKMGASDSLDGEKLMRAKPLRVCAAFCSSGARPFLT